MWTFIFIYILGLNICQATGEDNSTQMYYAKLTIEESAIGNITEILKGFVSNTTVQVDGLEITTTCQNVSAHTECTCKPNYRWSDKVCKSNQKCCGDKICTFPQNLAHMCVSHTTVAIKGSIILTKLEYYNCLSDDSETFKQCNNQLLNEMKKVYSTLRGFDILKINKYSAGSIIVDFEMTIANSVNPKDLIEKSNLLSSNLSASLELETTGVVHLSMPTNPVYYQSKHSLKCTSQEDLGTLPVWQLKKDIYVTKFDITNGTESTVTSATRETEVELQNINEVWAGEYTCVYHQNSNKNKISHKASAVLDVCLLPNIDQKTAPQFPRCKNNSGPLTVRAICEIGSSNETYTVTWESLTTGITLIPLASSSELTVYAAQISVSCDSANSIPHLTCTFKNRCNQTRNASVDINIIYANEAFCADEGDWKETKAGFTAVLKCKDASGQRQRKCKDSATWEPEVSACVNQDLNDVLKRAIIADIGLGTLDENAADVFSRLQAVTNNTQTINTFANINASIHVLFSLSQKDKLKPNESSFNDFLDSSSNLLEKSLENSWVTEADKSSFSLAERYLSSVEQIIHAANITGAPKKTNIEVAKSNCSQESNCSSTVFNVSIVLESQHPGSVKTAGFKELQNYLPNKDDKYNPNSHVVSVTTEKKELDTLKVKITFPLLKPRPRNVEIKCVSWENNTRTWSSEGCKWTYSNSSSNEEQCVCTHLSSFAILMSKTPLYISGLEEITYVGLSISVMSLIVSLVIELIVWNAVVRTNSLYLRHTAHVNISLCLLVADCCFLASSKPGAISEIWCKTFVVLKHFCYLSMFFWMLCLSSTLLHQAVFLFHNVSKKNYLRFSLVLGYVCPLLIVVITFLANNGDEGLYFSSETCWLLYSGLLKGSIHTFIIPVGIIVFINVFSMLVVIMKLLDHPKNTEKSHEKEKKAAITVMRSVIFLTPIFGVTWIFGFAVMLLDLTSGYMAYAVNYAFTLLNAFQGLFILLTTCLGDKLTREALLNRLKHNAPASTIDSSTKLDSTLKK
ncbi:adhesion G-protein coupled receptor F3 [Siniperca chuatsi]|uniref:adhesion G-protein coupled receptor F3 n=1 Tax=Siniperca chuatsi TaxID=119488 RepID=UPI001CE0A692|nr:adhesion G-protein coupled receptor F3 [Siniperca chuatsi]XP_044022085.1 adhesion G-protein coupled receptor F3 [Siniperca chuatsi]